MEDLFDENALPGLAQADAPITSAQEAQLIAAIDAAGLTPFRFQGWVGKRLTRSFGWSYDFDSGAFVPSDPLPDWLLPVRAQAAAFAGMSPDDFLHALVIRYDPGATIGWHRDRPVFEHVVGLSLGNPATLRLRRRLERGFQRANVTLAPRAFYHLAGAVRHEWEHSIAALRVPRWSITFRSLSEKGRRAAQR